VAVGNGIGKNACIFVFVKLFRLDLCAVSARDDVLKKGLCAIDRPEK
jgi:hypothetical protein